MSTLPELEEVQEDFNMGIICAQQVLAHFADRLGLTEETALRIASAFGSGMGKAEVCGCVSGSLMVLGMLHGPSGPCSRPQKDAFYARRDAFTGAFAKAHGSLQCRGVMGHDITTPEGMAAVKQNNLFIKTCAPLVCHTCALLEDYL